jgi:glutathione S-transferase
MTAALTLHGYWRSSAAYRVRIGLNLKGVDYAQVSYDLTTGAQRQDDYLAIIAPHGLVPALETGGTILIESPAILEWIEATWPTPPLLPDSADEAAIGADRMRHPPAQQSARAQPAEGRFERLRGAGAGVDSPLDRGRLWPA